MGIERGYVLDLIETSCSILNERCSSTPFAGKFIRDSVAFVGDTHCAWEVSSKVLSDFLGKVDLMVFLGDYVDRGNTGVENLAILLEAFVHDPQKIILLRGNHESKSVNEMYGFKDEVDSKFGRDVYPFFEKLFSMLPYAAVVNGYFCVHGGIARNVHTVDKVADLPYHDTVPESGDAIELLWNDPSDEVSDFSENVRGEGTFYYGKNGVDRFLSKNGLNGIIRGHETCDGFKTNLGGEVITVFSSLYHNLHPGVLLLKGGNFEYIQIETSHFSYRLK